MSKLIDSNSWVLRKQPTSYLKNADGIHPYPLGSTGADKHLVLIFHDETVLHSNDGRIYAWHEKGTGPLHPKDQGRGIMVTNVIDEFYRYIPMVLYI